MPTFEELTAAVEKALGEIGPALSRAHSIIAAIASHQDAVESEIKNLAEQAGSAIEAITGSHAALTAAAKGATPPVPGDKPA